MTYGPIQVGPRTTEEDFNGWRRAVSGSKKTAVEIAAGDANIKARLQAVRPGLLGF